MKDNKLIAEFMGKEIYQKHHESNYHCSWDWLMPVIEKIQDIFVDDPELDWQLYDDIRLNVPYLDDTYNAVVYTIKQYNNGKQ